MKALLDRFETEILNGNGSLSDRIGFSHVKDTIRDRAEEAIPMIQIRLKERTGSPDPRVIQAWTLLLGWMQPGQTAGSVLAQLLVDRKNGASEVRLTEMRRHLEQQIAAQLTGTH